MRARIGATIRKLSNHVHLAAAAGLLMAGVQAAHAVDTPPSYLWLENDFYNASFSARLLFSPLTELPDGHGSNEPDQGGFSTHSVQLGNVTQDVWQPDGALSSLSFTGGFSMSRGPYSVAFDNVRLDALTQQIFATAHLAETGSTITDLALWSYQELATGAQTGWGVDDAELVTYGLKFTSQGLDLLGSAFKMSPILTQGIGSMTVGTVVIPTTVPEPGTAALSLLGLGGLVLVASRRRQQAQQQA